MDSFLINYLSSGKAVVLVGSGPSAAMGYPSWEKLAKASITAIRDEQPGVDIKRIKAALLRNDYPTVLDNAEKVLGSPRLRQVLQSDFRPERANGKVYELITMWPVKTYLTTNFDDELQNHLTALGEAYITFNNTEDHLAQLTPETSGAIYKLHGDFRSDNGLILTKSHYDAIQFGPQYEYWRTKITSVFQMLPVVIIGHSLTDANFKHVLVAAQKGCRVTNPVCWIAPDVPPEQRREFLEKYRIRVISYDNRDGHHQNLVTLLDNISNFVPPRVKYHAKDQISRVVHSPLGNNAAAPGFFVFNKLCSQESFEKKRQEIIIAAMLAGLKGIDTTAKFTIEQILLRAGWPKDNTLNLHLQGQVVEKALSDEIIVKDGVDFRIGPNLPSKLSTLDSAFVHLKSRFLLSLKLRIKRKFSNISETDAQQIAEGIDNSLAGFFREGGVTLSSVLFKQKEKKITLPTSIVKFINEACTNYASSLFRQVFFVTAIDIFISPETSEREYLGRVSQGFFGFHTLGVFGDAAVERYNEAKETVWLLDSSVQIPALAIGHPTNPVFLDTITRLKSGGLRLFTTEKLFDETREHFWFANWVVVKYGPQSEDVLSAATGQPPYRKSNVFLEAFINWQSAGNTGDWREFCYHLFNNVRPEPNDLKKRLNSIGIEIVDFQSWPGFTSEDFVKRTEILEKIANVREDKFKSDDPENDPLKKSMPEAEALVIVLEERDGKYHILSEAGTKSPAWFVSGTSILNIVTPSIGTNLCKITWQPEAFLNFASTLSPPQSEQAANQAFDVLLWSVAQCGISLIDESITQDVFQGIIDQATLDIELQKQLYDETLQQKYGESVESIMKRLPKSFRPLAATQFAYELAEELASRVERAEKIACEERIKAKAAEKIAKELQHLQKKLSLKKAKGKKQRRKQGKK